MATITRGTKSGTGTTAFGASTSAKASEVNTDFNTVYSAVNSLDNDNIAVGANIAAAKLNLSTIAQNINLIGGLTTDAHTTAALILTSAQVTPILAVLDEDNMVSNSTGALCTQQSIKAYADSLTGNFATGTFDRDIATDGDLATSGVGFQPEAIIFFACVTTATGRASWGFTVGTDEQVMFDDNSTSAGTYSRSGDVCIFIRTADGVHTTAVLKSMDTDGFTLTFTKAGSPTGTATVKWFAMA